MGRISVNHSYFLSFCKLLFSLLLDWVLFTLIHNSHSSVTSLAHFCHLSELFPFPVKTSAGSVCRDRDFWGSSLAEIPTNMRTGHCKKNQSHADFLRLAPQVLEKCRPIVHLSSGQREGGDSTGDGRLALTFCMPSSWERQPQLWEIHCSSHSPDTVQWTHSDRVVMSAESVGQHHGEETARDHRRQKRSPIFLLRHAVVNTVSSSAFPLALGSLPREGRTRSLCQGSSRSWTWRSTSSSETKPGAVRGSEQRVSGSRENYMSSLQWATGEEDMIQKEEMTFFFYWTLKKIIYQFEREKQWFVVSLIHSLVASICALTREETCNLGVWDDALTNELPGQGLLSVFYVLVSVQFFRLDCGVGSADPHRCPGLLPLTCMAQPALCPGGREPRTQLGDWAGVGVAEAWPSTYPGCVLLIPADFTHKTHIQRWNY